MSLTILHAGWHLERLWLWGEKTASEVSSPPAGKSAEHLAEALPAVALRRALAVTGLVESHSAQLKIWLPTQSGRAVMGAGLTENTAKRPAKTTLAGWPVAVAGVELKVAADLLSLCLAQEVLAPGLVAGPDLLYWAQAWRFAGALTARQQFLPSLVWAEKSARAVWRPFFNGPEMRRLVKLAQLMPQVCRALSDTKAAQAPDLAAKAVLQTFLGEAVDYLARPAPEAPAALTTAKGKKAKTVLPSKPAFDSLHDQWLYALRAADGKLVAEAAELRQLDDALHEWQRPLTALAATPFRLSFRLEEPPDPEAAPVTGKRKKVTRSPDEWYLGYHLQAVDEQSLMVPLEDAWKARSPVAELLRRDNFKPREYTLAALGEASKLSASVEQSLAQATPGGQVLDTAGAFRFLQEEAWLLEQAGFGVLLPAWWTRKGTKARIQARAQVKSQPLPGGGVMTLASILEFDWQLAIGDELLTEQELAMLAKLQSPLVRLRGQWVQLNAEEIAAALEFWRKREPGQATARELALMALGAQTHTPRGLSVSGVQVAGGWLQDLLAQLEGGQTYAELPPPDGLQATLRPYQKRGASWLSFLRQWGFGACLADDMGLGKTITALTLFQREREAGEKRPVLLIAPMSVVGNWEREAARFTPELPVLVHHGLARKKGKEFTKAAEQSGLVVSSYALLHRDAELLQKVPWAGVVLDEAQNIKNPVTKQAQAARGLAADYKIALTGTPVENNVNDLWSLMEFLNPGLLGTQAAFRRNYFLPIQVQQDEAAAQSLQRLTGPFILRRLKTDKSIIADLPDKLEMKVFCTLTKEQASLYEAEVQRGLDGIAGAEGIERKGLVLSVLMRLKQICNHPAQFLGDNSAVAGRSGKLARLSEMLEEIFAVGEKALVFTQFAGMGRLLQSHLQDTYGREVLFLHGGVAQKQRDRLVERFQLDDPRGPRVFLLSLKAGGTGLNLTAANHVFHFDRWWNPAVENQATDRAFRIGQKKNVQVHKYLCAGTLEEKIDAMIERKQELAQKIVGSGEGWLTQLSTSELKEMFALRPDAVGE